MGKLPKDQIIIDLCPDGKYVMASLGETDGYRQWEMIKLSDLPNNDISLDDLKRFGINLANLKNIRAQLDLIQALKAKQGEESDKAFALRLKTGRSHWNLIKNCIRRPPRHFLSEVKKIYPDLIVLVNAYLISEPLED